MQFGLPFQYKSSQFTVEEFNAIFQVAQCGQ